MSACSSSAGSVVEAHRLAAEALGEADRAVVVAVGDEHRAARRARSSARAVSSPVSPAPITITRAPAQVAEGLLRELHRDRADRHAAARRSPVSVRTRLPAASASRKSRFMNALVVLSTSASS